MADLSTVLQTNQSNSPLTFTSSGASQLIGPSRNPQNVIGQQNNSVSPLEYLDERPKYYMELRAYDYHRANLLQVGNLTASGSPVVLPLPSQLVNVHDQNWVQESLQRIGTIGAGIGMVAGGATNVKAEFSGLSGQQSALAAAQGISNGLGGTSNPILSQGFQAADAILGIAPNQFVTILYAGPKYKVHSFTWIISPRTFAESSRLRDIVAFLNNSMAPGVAAGGLIWTYPKIFKIAFQPNSGWLYKFKPAVLQNFVANWTPLGRAGFYFSQNSQENPPEGVVLTMQFVELEYWITGDFSTDNTPDNVYGGGVFNTDISGSISNFLSGVQNIATQAQNAITPGQ